MLVQDNRVSTSRRAPLERLRHDIEHAAEWLPSQGPINVFIHHNTLHPFEHLPFHQAVRAGARLYGCQPYLTKQHYRQNLERGRFTMDDVRAVLAEHLGATAEKRVADLSTRFELQMAMLEYPLRSGTDEELRWVVAVSEGLHRFRDDVPPAVRDRTIQETRHWIMRDIFPGQATAAAVPSVVDAEPSQNGRPTTETTNERDRHIQAALSDLMDEFGAASIESWSQAKWERFTLRALWRICRDGVHGVGSRSAPPPLPLRHRDLLLEATGEDTDQLVHPLLIRYCAAFLDQGIAHWPLPSREKGFFQAFIDLYILPGGPPDAWLRGLRRELKRIREQKLSPLESIRESLTLLGVEAEEEADFIAATMLALRGWFGMVWQMEQRGERAARPVPEGSLVEALAVRLILERLALGFAAAETIGYHGPLAGLRPALRQRIPKREPVSLDQRAFTVFELAQLLGWNLRQLNNLTKPQWTELVTEVESFDSLQRRQIHHEAFERRYRLQALDALYQMGPPPPPLTNRPRFQAAFCLDDREESFRRHLEELAPDAETLGVAGFYNVPMYYRGAGDAHFVPLCPVVVSPQHWTVEEVVLPLEEVERRRAKVRKLLGSIIHRLHLGSRTATGGALIAATVGSLASVPLVGRVLFPRLAARVRHMFSQFIQPPPITRLQLDRIEPAPSPVITQMGFTVAEMADMGERVLRDMGLISNFARIVMTIGHGSSSLNNPHKSAYDCGACGGGAGGPNGRAIAQILNDPRVRQVLANRGIAIPSDTVFVGGLHNTCDDSVTFYDLDRVPNSHREEFKEILSIFREVRARNAHERCRRFQSAPLSITPEAALRHVEERSEDLAQTRPELGHATNAFCHVGRRSRTRGLFMDRRAFLTSYDPEQDDENHSVLARVLAAVFPVCAGINLEYFFSYVDNARFGSGSKLPHNVASLLGVMDGHASDLRTGLPWQMVEIHEPLRLLIVVETTPEVMLKIMEQNEGIDRLCRNGWVQVATQSPDSDEIQLFNGERFEPYEPGNTPLPEVPASAQWYRGWRDHLGFARIKSPADSKRA